MTDTLKETPRRRPLGRIFALALLYLGLLAGGHLGSEGLVGWVGEELGSDATDHAWHAALGALALYGVLMALPFVPGIEISLALMAAFGAQIAPLVYGATLCALTLAFVVGQRVSLAKTARLFHLLGMSRAETLVRDLAPLDRAARVERLMESTPKRWVPFLLRHRYIALALVLNTPGNGAVGGGGGIALLAGLSGLFSTPRFLATLAVATLPVPLAVFLTGS